MIKSYPKVFKLLLHPKTLCTTTSSCNVLCFSSGYSKIQVNFPRGGMSHLCFSYLAYILLWEVFRRCDSGFLALFKIFNLGFNFKCSVLIWKTCIFIFQSIFLNKRVSFITNNMYRFFHTQCSPIKHSICLSL